MYKKLYKEIIEKAKQEKREKYRGAYYEQHHIVPDFMFKNRKRKGPKGHLDGDPNHSDNLILLTFQEHLLCHYYLFKIHEGTKYEFQAGSALQFFFTKALGNHERQSQITPTDLNFLDEMAHLRKLGIESISRARKGKMPVVDAVTREKMGSVPVNHPKVLSGEWVHHSKGRKSPVKNRRDSSGDKNNNYKELTQERRVRLLDCVSNSIIDQCYFSRKIFIQKVKEEFKEFKKISEAWVCNNFGSLEELVKVFNKERNATILYERYYRSIDQRKSLAQHGEGFRWVTDGVKNIRLSKSMLDDFLAKNTYFRTGRINVKNQKNYS